MAKSGKDYELRIKIIGNADSTLSRAIKKTTREIDAAEASLRGMDAAGTAYFHALEAAAAAAAASVAAVVGASVSVGMSFEKQMSAVQSISGATGQELEALREQALQLGRDTAFSATEAAEGMENLASAGFATTEIIDAMPGLLDLAAASGEDLATSSEIAATTLRAFQMEASEAGHVADVLAENAAATNAAVYDTGEAMQYVAPVAASMGIAFEETAAAIGILSNNSIKGSQAGTTLRGALSRIAKPTSAMRDAMDALGVSFYDGEGRMKSLSEQISMLQTATEGLTNEQRDNYLVTLYGQESLSGMLALINSGAGALEELTEQYRNCEGAAAEMAEIRLDNLAGDVTLLQSAMESLGIQIYDSFSGGAREGVQGITEIVGVISEEFDEKLPTITRNLKETGADILEFAEPLIGVGEWCLENPDVVSSALIGIGSALVTYKVGSGLLDLGKGFMSLAGVLTNPFALSITAVGVAIGGAMGIGHYMQKCAKEAEKANLAEHFGNISLSLEELDQVAKYIVDDGNLSKVQEALSGFEELDGIQEGIEDAVAGMDRLNWKVSIGMVLTDADITNYKSYVDSYLSGLQEYASQQQYSVNLAVSALTGDEGDGIVNSLNSFYTAKQGELSALGTQLNECITDAFTDGLLDIDEVQEITELQRQMANVQSAIAGSEFEAQLSLLGTEYSGKDLTPEDYQNLTQELQEQSEAAAEAYRQAYVESVAAITQMRDDESFDYSQEDYNVDFAVIEQEYLQKMAELNGRVADFQLNTLESTYGDQIAQGGTEVLGAITGKLDEIMTNDGLFNTYTSAQDWANGLYNTMVEALNSVDIDPATRDAINTLYEQMMPTREQLEEYKDQCIEAGQEIPQAVIDSLTNIDTIGAIVGDEDAVWTLIGQQLGNSEEYSTVIALAENQGAALPEALRSAMLEKQPEAVSAAQSIVDEIASQFEAGIDVSIPVSYEVVADYYRADTKESAGESKITAHASGGIFDEPHIGLVAEAGPEAIIPLNSSTSSLAMWQQAGEALGVSNAGELDTLIRGLDDADSGGLNIAYSPTLQFYGDAPKKEDIQEALDDSLEKFDQMMQRWMREKRRVSFG